MDDRPLITDYHPELPQFVVTTYIPSPYYVNMKNGIRIRISLND